MLTKIKKVNNQPVQIDMESKLIVGKVGVLHLLNTASVIL